MNRNKLVWSTIGIATILVLVLSVCLYAAITTPDAVHTLDGWGVEPSKGSATMRNSTILTTSYVETDIIDTSAYSKMVLLIDVTKGSLASLQYRVWISYDNVNWFVEATEAVAAGVVTDTDAYYTKTLGANVKYFKVLQSYAAYMKLEVKGTGTVTGSLCAIYYGGVQQ